jgi:hypothetical protein
LEDLVTRVWGDLATGIYTRTGSTFDAAGIALQVRWGGGL